MGPGNRKAPLDGRPPGALYCRVLGRVGAGVARHPRWCPVLLSRLGDRLVRERRGRPRRASVGGAQRVRRSAAGPLGGALLRQSVEGRALHRGHPDAWGTGPADDGGTAPARRGRHRRGAQYAARLPAGQGRPLGCSRLTPATKRAGRRAGGPGGGRGRLPAPARAGRGGSDRPSSSVPDGPVLRAARHGRQPGEVVGLARDPGPRGRGLHTPHPRTADRRRLARDRCDRPANHLGHCVRLPVRRLALSGARVPTRRDRPVSRCPPRVMAQPRPPQPGDRASTSNLHDGTGVASVWSGRDVVIHGETGRSSGTTSGSGPRRWTTA